MPDERTQLNIRVDEDTLTRLRMIAVVDSTTVSDLVRRGVEDLIARYVTDPDFQERRQHWVRQLQDFGELTPQG